MPCGFFDLFTNARRRVWLGFYFLGMHTYATVAFLRAQCIFLYEKNTASTRNVQNRRLLGEGPAARERAEAVHTHLMKWKDRTI
jgi:hypothetical protein